jgi:hypothetical protein
MMLLCMILLSFASMKMPLLMDMKLLPAFLQSNVTAIPVRVVMAVPLPSSLQNPASMLRVLVLILLTNAASAVSLILFRDAGMFLVSLTVFSLLLIASSNYPKLKKVPGFLVIGMSLLSIRQVLPFGFP